MLAEVRLICADALEGLRTLPDASVDCIITSPPYYRLRDYGVAGQIGQEATWREYVARLVAVFAEAKRVLRPEGSLWINLGDTFASGGYGGWEQGHTRRGLRSLPGEKCKGRAKRRDSGLRAKCLMGISWRVAFALIDDGWILRGDIIWAKGNGIPESVRDRFSRKHEYLFHFVKQPRYYFDLDAVQEPQTSFRGAFSQAGAKFRLAREAGRAVAGHARMEVRKLHPLGKNPGSVWQINTKPFPEAHFATFPPELCRRPILATCPPGGWVLDPFCGSGTALLVAQQFGQNAIGIDIKPEYIEMARRRLRPTWTCGPSAGGWSACSLWKGEGRRHDGSGDRGGLAGQAPPALVGVPP